MMGSGGCSSGFRIFLTVVLSGVMDVYGVCRMFRARFMEALVSSPAPLGLTAIGGGRAEAGCTRAHLPPFLVAELSKITAAFWTKESLGNGVFLNVYPTLKDMPTAETSPIPISRESDNGKASRRSKSCLQYHKPNGVRL